mgnify:CR=1 FL=1
MNVVLDTSVIVEIDRKNQDTILVIKKLIDKNHEILVSTVTISEILTGSYLRRDFEKAVEEAKRILGQFLWIDLDASVAEKTAQYIAYLIAEDKTIEYQDVAIAATFKVTDADYLLTLNKAHFELLPDLKGRVYEPKEFAKIIK